MAIWNSCFGRIVSFVLFCNVGAAIPRVSDRQKVLRAVKDELYLPILLQNSNSDSDDSNRCSKSANSDSHSDNHGWPGQSDSEFVDSSDKDDLRGDSVDVDLKPDELMELYFVMESIQYFAHRPIAAKSKDFALNFFSNLPVKMFRQMTRMDKEYFFDQVDRIEDHLSFSNNSCNEQTPVAWQLAITLDRLGHDGNGACLNHMIPTWGVSNGSLCNFTSRCVTAMEDFLQAHLKWPDREERARISEELALVIFWEKPQDCKAISICLNTTALLSGFPPTLVFAPSPRTCALFSGFSRYSTINS